MARHTELRELRSLERPSMYTIFHPLDANERLPRELMLEGRRHRRFGITQFELAIVSGSCLLLLVGVVASFGLNPMLVLAVGGIPLAGYFVHAAVGKSR